MVSLIIIICIVAVLFTGNAIVTFKAGSELPVSFLFAVNLIIAMWLWMTTFTILGRIVMGDIP